MSALTLPIDAYLGIDVAKAKLDVVLRRDTHCLHHIFENSVTGYAQMHAWLQGLGLHPQQLHASLEATGSYSDAVATFLYSNGYSLSILNPAVLVDYRRSQNTRSKTDKLDANLLACYGQERHPRLWKPLPEPIVTLRALLAYRTDQQQMLRQERNRLEAGRMTDWIEQNVRTHVADLQRHLKEAEQQIKKLLREHTDLTLLWKRLQTIPGIGWLSAARFIAHLGEIERFAKVGSVVSLAGLAVKECQSGSSVRGKPQIDRHGRSDLRQTMYMCALVALRCSSHMQAWTARLRTQGKAKKIILVAVMRKLLHIAYGVWKTGDDYRPEVAFPLAA